jgi:hypothetical protein
LVAAAKGGNKKEMSLKGGTKSQELQAHASNLLAIRSVSYG